MGKKRTSKSQIDDFTTLSKAKKRKLNFIVEALCDKKVNK